VNHYKPSPGIGRPSISASDDPMLDYRTRLVQSQAEAAERRRLDLAEQCSRLKTLAIIAANTGLSADDVRDEQQRRATLRAAV
jgi:hypothetical protein